MKPFSKELRIALAGEYVLGNLGARARRRFHRLLGTDRELQREVEAWHRRMDVLAMPSPLAPPGMVWTRIDRDLNRADHRVRLIRDPQQSGRQTTSGLWQAWAGLATAAAVYLAVLVVREEPVQRAASLTPAATEAAFESAYSRVQSVRSASPAAPRNYRGYMGTVSLPSEPARWRVSVDLDTRMLRVESVGEAVLGASEDYQLWWVSDEEIVSVGLLPRRGGWELVLPRHLRLTDFSRLAVTREPAYGSPADGPTGPVLMNASLRPSG